ncbi:MAG: transcription termination/antitermination NusG family protein [Terracidiphilus sp.]
MNQIKYHNRWVALQVRRRHESNVFGYLSHGGYEVLLPRRRRCKSCSEECNGEVLFPGYLFCRFDAHNQFRILTAPGFVRFVGFGNHIPTLEQHELDGLRILGECTSCLRSAPPFQQGAPVRITSGPLTGILGHYVRSGKKGSLFVSVTLLNRSVRVELSDSDVVQLASNEEFQHRQGLSFDPAWAVGLPQVVQNPVGAQPSAS